MCNYKYLLSSFDDHFTDGHLDVCTDEWYSSLPINDEHSEQIIGACLVQTLHLDVDLVDQARQHQGQHWVAVSQLVDFLVLLEANLAVKQWFLV